MQDKLFQMLMQKNELTWQTIIYDLVKSEQMDPWDIDISLLTKKYLETIQKLKEHNFFISGKIILASAILLKLKSIKLITEHLKEFDNLLFQREENLLEEEKQVFYEETPSLLIKTPQPRKRKVSLNDLMKALQKALEVNERRVLKKVNEKALVEIQIPEKKVDITKLILDLYSKIKQLFMKKEVITFTGLVNSNRKEDKIYTFVPLLHLANQGKVDLDQKEHFGEIFINKPIL